MAFKIKDRVKEGTTTTGTGAVALSGASATFDTFQSYMSNGDTTYYAIVHTATGIDEWEVGLGTWNTGNTLTRTTVLAGSNGTSAVTFGAGAKDVFMTYPASRAALANDDVTFASITVTGNVDGRDVAADGTKLDTVETNADVTDAVNIAAAGALMRSGGTMTGNLVLNANPSAALGAATKEYVDTIASAGIHYHDPVRVEHPSNLTVTYSNGSSGVGATLTNAGTNAAIVLDGVTLVVNDRVLVSNQTDQTQNGVYKVTTVGDSSTAWVLTRSVDTDSSGPSDPNALGKGDAFFTKEGSTNAGHLDVMTTAGTIVFGTTNIVFAEVAETTVYSAGTGLTLTGTQFAIGQAVATSDNVTFNQVTANIIGNVTGNVTGNTSGNAGTATALATARTIAIAGDVVGSATFDGSANISITAAVQDDSHAHVITNVDGLQTALDAKTNTSRDLIAGNGLTGGGDLTVNRTFAVGAGTGITVNANDVAHGSTSSQASLTALTGAAVVSDIDLDGFGHVTNLTTRNMTLSNLGYTGATDANNSTSNATHTGEVTGSGALTVADNVIDAGNLKVSGNGSNTQFLRSDGDGTFTWAVPTDTNTDTNTTYSAGTGLTLTGTVFSATSDPTLTLAGDATGTATFTNLGNATLTVVIADDSHYHSQVQIPDTRGAARAPSYYPDRYTSFDFQENTDTGAGGDQWHVLQTVSPWSSYNSSHRQQQIAFTGTGGLKFRYATSDTAWAGWQTLWTSGNDGTGSGLDADLLDGQHASAFAAASHTHSYLPLAGGTMSGDTLVSNYGIGNVGLYSSTKYQAVWSMGNAYKQSADGSSLSNLYGIAYTHTNIGGSSKPGLSHQALFVENGAVKAAIGTGMWTSGVITTTSNIVVGGTVDGRDVATDGTKLDTIATSANNYSFPYTISQAAGNDTVVRRHASGYIFANYFNTTPNTVTSGITQICVETANDGYIRHGTAAAVRSFINVADGANVGLPLSGGTITGTLEIAGTGTEKIILSGATMPYISFKEGTTPKANIQWNNDGYLKFGNRENGQYLFRCDIEGYSADLVLMRHDTVVYTGESLGSINFCHTDGVHDFPTQTIAQLPARIEASSIETAGDGDDGARIRFFAKSTNANKATTSTVRMDINGNGNTYLYTHLEMNNYAIKNVDFIQAYNDSNTFIQFHELDQFRVVTGGSERFEITNSAVTSYIELRSTANVVAYYSDERLKTKVGDIENAVEKVKTLDAFYYVENDLAKTFGYDSDKKQVALSAQDVQKVLPEAVTLAPFDMEDDHETGETYSKSGENYLTVDYAKMVPLLIQAIKEQQQQIDTLKAEVSELRGK